MAAQDPGPAGIEITGTAQREAWLRRAMPPVEQLAGDLWSIPVPIPDNPLRYVSSYAFGTGEGLVLIDAGWGSEEAWQALTAGLESIGAQIADVRGVLVTHLHFDHLGLAGRIRQACGAWIALHPADHAVLSHPDYRDAELAVAREAEFLRGLGASEAEAAAAVGDAAGWEMFTRDRAARPADRGRGAGRRARLEAPRPAHARPHPRAPVLRGRALPPLFSGDHVLPRITPNISVQRGDPASPLQSYLESLAQTRDLDVDEVLPAHEWRFRGLAGRVDAITAHHERRLTELLDAVRRHPGATPWQLAGELTWSRPWADYGGQMRIFAVTETAAHVHQLERRGLVTASETSPPGYTATAA